MKQFIVHALVHILIFFQIHRIFRFLFRKKLLILLYHGVDEKRDLGIYNYRNKFITPSAFRQHLDYLRSNYHTIALDEAINMLKSEQALPPYSVAITFDDGYKNFADLALPILEEFSIPATIFIVTKFVDENVPLWVDRLEYTINHSKKLASISKNEKIKIDSTLREMLKHVSDVNRKKKLRLLEKEHDAKLEDLNMDNGVYQSLDWNDIHKMNNHPLIRIGSHTVSHPILTQIDRQTLTEEITVSKQMLRRKKVDESGIFCYPNGQSKDYNDEIAMVLSEYGYVGSLTTIIGYNDSDTNLFELRRMTVDVAEDFNMFLAHISGIIYSIKKIRSLWQKK